MLPIGDIASAAGQVRIVPHPGSCSAAKLFDHLVGTGRRHREVERLGSLHFDHQFEFGRLLYRQIGRLGALSKIAA